MRSLQHLETFAGKVGDDVITDHTCSVVIGIRRGEAAVSAVLELEREERRRKLDVTEDDYMNVLVRGY